MMSRMCRRAKQLRHLAQNQVQGATRGRAQILACEPRLFLSAAPTASSDQTNNAKAAQAFDLASAIFVQNQGQWENPDLKFAYNGHSIDVGFTNQGPIVNLIGQASVNAPVQQIRLAMTFDGGQTVAPTGVERSPTLFNFLTGDASQHRSNVPGYQKVQYTNLYDGIDLLAWGQSAGMKYEFHVAPGADWNQIHLSYAGSNGLRIATDGSLHIATPLGDLVEHAPVLYQMIDGQRVEVAGKFVLVDSDTYAFQVTGQYDHAKELVIDPDLSWSSYLGAGNDDYGQAIAIDASGNAYVAGYTASANWASSGAYNTNYAGNNDVFVAKLNSDGNQLLYATYLGGIQTDVGTGIAVDSSGNAYITGYTSSAGWATAGSYDPSFNGGFDAFIAKLNANGSSMQYATYLGAGGADYGYGIAIDGSNNAYITGFTASGGWASAGASDTSFNGGDSDAFVAKIGPAGNTLGYMTYFGGSGNDFGNAIAVDSSGNAYITGQVGSAGLATAGAYDTSYGQNVDAFVAKFSANGSTLSFASYLGGSGMDAGNGIAVDKTGVYVSGSSASGGWAKAGSYDDSQNGGSDAFVAKLDLTGASLIYATYLGGTGDDFGNGLAIDSSGNAYLTGYSGSSKWTPDVAGTTPSGGYDAYIAKISASGAYMPYISFVGGANNDIGYGIAVDNAGNGYIAGNTFSGAWTSANGYDSSFNGGTDAFAAKFTGLDKTVIIIPGDANGDGKVDFADLVAVAQNYGGENKTRDQGDVTGDGNVNFADLVEIAQNYGTTGPASGVISAAATPVAVTSTSTVNKKTVQRVAVVAPKKKPFATRKRIDDAVWRS